MSYHAQKKNKHVLSASVHILTKQNNGKKMHPLYYGKPKDYIECIMVPDKSGKPKDYTMVPDDIWKTEKPPPLHPKESTCYTRNNFRNISSKGHEPTLKLVDCIIRIKVNHNHLSKTPILGPKFSSLTPFQS